MNASPSIATPGCLGIRGAKSFEELSVTEYGYISLFGDSESPISRVLAAHASGLIILGRNLRARAKNIGGGQMGVSGPLAPFPRFLSLTPQIAKSRLFPG